MQSTRPLLRASSAALLLAFAACGGDDASNLERACSAACSKLAECNLLVLISESQCESLCVTEAQEENPSCSPTDAEVNACISAAEAASCSTTEAPVECTDICEDESDGGVGTDASVDASFDANFEFDADIDANITGTCSDLSGCCPNLTGIEKISCDTAVTLGIDASCGALLASIQLGGNCT